MPDARWFLSRFLLIVIVTVATSSTSLAAQDAALPWPDLADALVARMDLQSGERVLLVGRAGDFDPLVLMLRQRIARAGAVDLGAVEVGGGIFTGSAPTDFVRSLAGLGGSQLVDAVSSVDLGLMLPGATPGDAVYGALQDVLRTGKGRTIHFHWAGAYGFDGAPLPLSDYIKRTYVTALTNTDYDALSDMQASFEEAARAGSVRVTTPAGTDISFRIGDRPVTRQDGDASAARASRGRNLIDREVELPAGAVRVAPIESTVDGTIAFPPTVWAGTEVEALVLTVEAGRVVNLEAGTGVEAVRAELDAAGEAGYSFREFALGLNPLLAIPESGDPWIPYYGYGAGVVRLSLGDNSELGGQVTGGYVRWNFFTDATVTVSGDTWVQEGRLVR